MLDDDRLCNIVITMDMTYSKLSQLKENRAPSADGFAPNLLNEVANEISELLFIIFNPRKTVPGQIWPSHSFFFKIFFPVQFFPGMSGIPQTILCA